MSEMSETIQAHATVDSTTRAIDPPLSPLLRWSLVGLGSALAAIAILRAESLLSANDRSRWCTVWSLVEHGSYRIDEIDARKVLHKPSGKRRRRFGTIDKVYHEGHFYSTKPPLYPTLVAGLYAAVKTTTGWNLVEQTEAVSHVILMLVNWLPWTIALVVLSRMLDRYARHRSTRILLLTTAAVGTLLLPFLVALNNHTVAATAVIFSLSSILRITIDGDHRRRHFAVAGFFVSWAAANELPAAAFAVVATILLLQSNPRRTLTVFLPLALIPLAAFLGTNLLATGGWKPFYAYYGTEKYLWTVDGVESYWKNPKGIDRGGDSMPVYLMHCLVGHHGVFSLSPIWLVWLLGTTGRVRQSGSPLAGLWRSSVVLTLVVLGFYLSRTANYNYGGVSCALRWTLWLVPLWLVSSAPTLDAWADRGRGILLGAWFLLAVSSVSVFLPLENPFQHPWLFRLMEDWGWIAYQ